MKVRRPLGTPVPEDVLEMLQEFSYQAGMSDAANALGCSYGSLAAWLTGTRNISFRKLNALREALKNIDASR